MKSELNRLLVALRASNALSDTEFAAVQDSLSECEGETAVGRLLQDLVQAQKLTGYQAKRLARGDTLVLGEYLIEELLGEGGMGKVFKATHVRLRRPAALKVIRKKYLESDPQSAARFEREGRAIARLKHPNIVTAYDASVQDEVYFLAMEYIDGVTLDRLVSIGGSLTIREALECLTQAAEALECAHQKGVVHRDIKPSNLMVEKSTHHVKVLDLGVAQLASDKRNDGDLTMAGEIMGTFDYMAPEQADDAKLVDHRADIYSLGCTLYLMVTGKKIYEHAATRFEKTRAHREDPIPGLGQAGADVPAAVADLFEQMVKKDPDERPQTMTEIIHRLRQIRSDLFRDGAPTATMIRRQCIGEAVHETDADAVMGSAVASTGEVRTDSKHRRGKFVAMVLLALLVVGAVLLGIHLTQTPPRRPSPDDSVKPGANEDVKPVLKPLAAKVALLKFLVDKRTEIRDGGIAKIVADIHVTWDDRLPTVQEIKTTDEDFGDIEKHAKAMQLVRLDLGDTSIDDAELARLATVTELECLSLFKCEWLTDEAFRPLQELKSLKSIDLRGTKLSGEGLRQLPEAPLEELKVDGFHGKLNGADIVEVAERFKKLKRISVQGIPLNPEQQERLRPLLEEKEVERDIL